MNPLLKSGQVRVAGHRGHSLGAPENTLAAFRKARELGGAGVICETDLLMTRDGELVLIHDETVDKTTDGRGLVSAMTWEELSRLDAGSWFSADFAGEKVPSLREAVKLARELDIVYQVELKTYIQNEQLFAALRALVDELDCADRLQFSSFDLVQIRDIKKVIPEVPTIGHTHSRLIAPVTFAREANVDAVSLETPHFPQGEARLLHEAGIAANLYIPQENITALLEYGVDVRAQIGEWVREGLLDQIMCNDVALVAAIREDVYGR
ncbi:glycerophosphodiester phosphodiesterase family protein [Erwinia billingiae]|uniref:glycerophosphodiester phosphodiesterase n=1 Tax=Erwiniaceae TaxID=1903409 RepID=UPI0002710DAC|nr:glycerophosphodiester phosphodiesterase family protein [Pantoea sp. YR343]KAJ9431832.1 glycerophosphodiester phosphodiesterase family protein [Pantoea sp. YR343]